MQPSQQFLDSLQFEGDPLADAVIADLVGTGRIREVNTVLEQFRGNDELIPENLPPSVRDYLVATDNPPDWADLSRVARAQDFFVDDGMHVASVLSFGAMVNCYAQPRPSRVLCLTHRLNQPHRRLAETSQFVVNLMAPDPFGRAGSFVPTIQKTRLIHAAVRHFLTESPEWDTQLDGVPICQQDLLGALLIFSVQVIDGMRRIGISVTSQEAEDYWYVWRVAGTMLGIRTDAMPDTVAEADELNRSLVQQHYGPSPEGIELTENLLQLYQELMPGKAFDGVIPAMARKVVGPEIADMLRIPKSRWWTSVVNGGQRLMHRLERAEDDSKIARSVLDKAGHVLLSANVRTLTDGRRQPLNIPESLQHHRKTAAPRRP
jgi:hypothetical protein